MNDPRLTNYLLDLFAEDNQGAAYRKFIAEVIGTCAVYNSTSNAAAAIELVLSTGIRECEKAAHRHDDNKV